MSRTNMTKNLLRVAAVCIASIPASLYGSITVGTFNTGNCYPFMCNDSGVSVGQSIEYQQVYASSSFGLSPVSISTITFYWASVYGGASSILNGNYTVSLSTTGAAVGALSTTLSSNIGADNATFFNGALGGAFVNSFTISGAPFTYNPSGGNLLIDIVVTNQDNLGNGSGNGYNQADFTGLDTSRVYDNGSGGSSDGTGLVTTFDAGLVHTPEPAFMGLLAVGVAGLLIGRRRFA